MNRYFYYQDDELYVDGLLVRDLADTYGTPVYIYSHCAFMDRFFEMKEALKHLNHLVCFSVKANSNLSVLKSLVEVGSGLDVVSLGELKRALKVGCSPDKIVFAGVGKTVEEIRFALSEGIKMFDVESKEELELINQVALSMEVKAPVALRINPDTDAGTHQYITTGKKENKFGIIMDQARQIFIQREKFSGIEFVGVHVHIGSQITEVAPFQVALVKVKDFLLELKDKGVHLKVLNIGGGIGIRYQEESFLQAKDVYEQLSPILKMCPVDEYVCEPGRYIAGNSGIFVSQVLYVKKTGIKNFVIVDGAMTELIRPMLYGAYHHIESVQVSNEKMTADIVGPVCESGDCFGKNRHISSVDRGDYLAFFSAGAYAFVMSSHYNTRPNVPEILVKEGQSYVVRKREEVSDLWASEEML